MDPRTPAQLNAIRVWTEERDALITEIGTLTTDRDQIAQSNREAATSLTDLNDRIAEARGRIAELDALEERYRNSLATDIAALEARKSSLEAECVAEETKLVGIGAQQYAAVHNIEILILAHDKMSDQAKVVDEVVGQVIEASTNAVSAMKTDMSAVHKIVTEVIDRGDENVKQTNIVIDGLPKFIFDLQKPIPVQRLYPEGHPLATSEEVTQK